MTRDDPGQRPSAKTCATILRDYAHLLGTPLDAVPDLDVAPSDGPAGVFATTAGTEAEETDTISHLTHGESRRDRRRWTRALVTAAALMLILLLGTLALPDNDRTHEQQTPVRPSPSPTRDAASPSSAPTVNTSPNAVVPAAPNPPRRFAEPRNGGRDPGNTTQKTGDGKKKDRQENKKPKSGH